MRETAAGPDERADVKVLLASSRDWFASALRAVLEPEGFQFVHARSGEAAVEAAAGEAPDLVIIDEGLPDGTAPELCRDLLAGALGKSVPVLVYSPNFWHESEQAEAMRAGAWDIIREPIRSRLLVAKLERLLRIKRLIEAAEREEMADEEWRLFSLAGLIRTLPVLGSLAERTSAPMSCAVVGPTLPATGDGLTRQRRDTARLCARHTRLSDLCGFLGEGDVALVAYNADVGVTTDIIRRLSRLAEEVGEEVGEAVGTARAPLSAGIIELPADRLMAEARTVRAGPSGGEETAPVAEQIASLSRFAAAQGALRQARAAGGGIRIAESP